MITFPFDKNKGLIVISTRIWGTANDTVAKFALDTGATSTLVNPDVLEMLGYSFVGLRPSKMTTASHTTSSYKISVNKIQALGITKEEFLVISHTLPTESVDGLLGLDFLRNTRLIVDFKTGVVVLEI